MTTADSIAKRNKLLEKAKDWETRHNSATGYWGRDGLIHTEKRWHHFTALANKIEVEHELEFTHVRIGQLLYNACSCKMCKWAK